MILIQIKSSYFCAGLEAGDYDLQVKRAAPILKYMVGWSVRKVQAYAIQKGWNLKFL